MNGTHLSKRLQTVSDHVEPGSRLADIGSDHAYLPIYLAKHKVIDYGVAGEVAKGPLSNATKEITKEGLLTILHPRLADGLSAIQPQDQIDTITIAGMGGILISDILENGQARLSGREKLILQPNVGEVVVRRWLMTHHYQIKAEQILEEDGHIYEVITAVKSARLIHYSAKQLRFGPYLLAEKSPIFITKWLEECRQLQRVVTNMRRAAHEDTLKIQEIEQQIQEIDEVVNREG
ncbi:tRNA (adenine(22)-N(1))-methyltransferase [Lentilactobacillus raoultii]|uniref:tRNA (Adenine(22)-N(1))-methyltransferase n=1 Tax=Lentilactobacillus raoultii TaxID=1987503 RepID=A0ABW3PHJ7_9LACO|nr:class I SAM-dependent methyltransferase [Lentilactobacillus raoultii]